MYYAQRDFTVVVNLLDRNEIFLDNQLQYFHIITFQRVMKDALKQHLAVDEAVVSGGDDERKSSSRYQQICDRVPGLNLGPDKISKFCNARWPALGSPELTETSIKHETHAIKSEASARALWDYLSLSGDIERALKPLVSKRALFSDRMLATAMMSFYECHEDRISQYSSIGLTGQESESAKIWFAYKLSSIKPGFVVKSQFRIENVNDEYFDVADHHIQTGRFEANFTRNSHTYTGFGYVRTEKIWFHLRDINFFQPRSLCIFDIDKTTVPGLLQDTEKIVSMRGHVLENDRVKNKGFGSYKVAFIDPEVEKKLIEREVEQLGEDERCAQQGNNLPDYYPFHDEAKEPFEGREFFHIPTFIKKYLLD